MVKIGEVVMQKEVVRGAIVLAHGSRDPLWRQPVEAVARQMSAFSPAVQVRCAYLELSMPDLPGSAAELATLGVTSITVVPLFFGVGKHAREDLPLLMATLRANHPQVEFNLLPAIGEHAQVIDLIARIALSGCVDV